MQWGLAVNVWGNVHTVVEKCIVADQGGFDIIWITDFPAVRFAPVIAAAVAENTSSRIGVGLVSPFLYKPQQIVQFMSTLISTYGDRFSLLLGPGDRLRLENVGTSYGEASSLIARFVRWTKDIKDGLLHVNHNCPVWIGAQGPKMIAASGVADGVLLNYSDPEMIQWGINLVKERPKNFLFGAFPPSILQDQPDVPLSRELRFSAAIVALGLSKSVATKFELLDTLATARGIMLEKGVVDNDVVDAIPDDVLRRFGLATTETGFCEYVKSLKRVGIDLVTFGPPIGMKKKTIQKIAEIKNRCD
ncbi:MAG: LLM class flavin-dependent oxidoreductase [Candidatus Thorarchaeota archaeon]